jgi:subtilisin family serine protease
VARFIVSHRLAGKRSESERDASFSAAAEARQSFGRFTNILSELQPRGRGRGLMVVEGDPRDVERKRQDLNADIIVEAEMSRTPARYFPSHAAGLQPVSAQSGTTGIGASLELTITSEDGPLAGATVNVVLQNAQSGAPTLQSATTDADGLAVVAYSPGMWRPAGAIILPRGGFWSWSQTYLQNKMTIQLPRLPRAGPLGWWHQLLGMTEYSEERGKGIRVGVVDTGVGPHPYLGHIGSAGAYTNGGFDASAGAAKDVGDHGTHVSGIIAGRPGANSQDYGGIAAGADVFMARVFPDGGVPGQEGSASNGDIAAAIDGLATTQQVDVMNLSLGGPQASEIEMDAVGAAIEAGVLVICAAGNGNGAPVMYPAACPGAVAVSALGLAGVFPAGSVDSLSLPQQADRFAANGLFAASFINLGPEVSCTGPGVAIVSTVPGKTADEAAYAAMSGTSMASPAVCAALAAVLAKDEQYQNLPRDASRAQYAWTVLARGLRQLGLNSQFQGYGLASTLP